MAVLFPLPDGIYFAVSPYTSLVMGLVLGYVEVSGNNLGYSKFVDRDGSKTLPSKLAWLLIYIPSALTSGAFLAYATGFLPALLKACAASGVATRLDQAGAPSDTGLVLVAAAVFIHFTKRILEVSFVHKFSGGTNVGSIWFISTAYAATVANLLYTQVMSTGLSAPSPDLLWVGFAVYLVGITGNGYHHWLLSRLRTDPGSKKYVVPQGGLFGLFVCPHYICEIIMYAGIAVMCRTQCACANEFVFFCYLTARTVRTKQWYLKKVDGFPSERGVLIPGVF